ncbi:hypothetical protein SEMRO_160_G072231.1 [Seminavis robusta]|uniref:Uncharacterized protein n=1 Tax=Seminavis robusta TaxID=568900 RepID=A0A9N8DIC2_9STRA|nr:hypothetical protein SEMRO_160_G072231.1 [Seminavis robusta]|eukprot:Sro160_g072231.1  (340) ;mRNA; r:68071-69090
MSRESFSKIRESHKKTDDGLTCAPIGFIMDEIEPHCVYTADEMLLEGLKLAGYKEERVANWKEKSKVDKFRSRYGSVPVVLCEIWEDLQTTEDLETRIPPKKLKLNYYLMAHHFLKRYPVETERESAYQSTAKTQREWVWYYVNKIGRLHIEKIGWGEEEEGDDIWVCTVDGTMSQAYEQMHPDIAKDPAMFDFKHHTAGYNTEIVLSIFRSQVLQFRPAEKAGDWPDRVIFRDNGGLRDKLRATEKKCIADGGYHAKEDNDVLSTPNGHDHPSVRKFKSRALKRHENFNSMLKSFKCCDDTHRHGQFRLQECITAVVVICQYQMENGNPLWNIYAGDM